MKTEWIIIDGYSLLHRDASARYLGHDLMMARQRLVKSLEPVVFSLAEKVTIVFDGVGEGGPGDEFAASSIEVIFSPSHLTADSVVERLVYNAKNPESITVVSSDRAERETVSAQGAFTTPCTDFLRLCEQRRNQARNKISHQKKNFPPPSLGDLFPT